MAPPAGGGGLTALRRAALTALALRQAQQRQLVARALRPLALRRTGAPPAPRAAAPVPGAEALWRSPAFAPAGGAAVPAPGSIDLLGETVAYPPADWSPPGLDRLRRFHLHYGEEVLAWARGGDVAAARAGIAAWVAGNPPAARGDGWHPYTVSTRIGSWVAAATIQPGLLPPGASDSLWRQLCFLSRNVEHAVLGNHVIRNARALVLGGLSFGSERHVLAGLELLRRELPEQVLPDGGHYERSPVYHLVVLRDLLEVRAAAGAAAGFLDGPVERMRLFAAAMARPDGVPALFNDGSPGAVLDLSEHLPQPPPGLAVFPDTGYAVLRQRGLWLAFDCGPLAPAFLPAHAHADALSLQLWRDGSPVVVDPGSTTYAAGALRDRERSTAAHATVCVDGRDQCQFIGAFRAVGLPAVRLLAAETWPGRPLAAVLEGEARYRGLVHRRRIEVAGDGLVVLSDTIEGRGRADIEVVLPLAAAASGLGVSFDDRLEPRDRPPATRAAGAQLALPVTLRTTLPAPSEPGKYPARE